MTGKQPDFMNRNYNILDIGDRMGDTGYIDFISPNEVIYPVMSGIDCFKRPFIVVKVYRNDIPCIQTFFKRYVDDNSSLWACASCCGAQAIFPSGGMTKETLKVVDDVISGEIVDIGYGIIRLRKDIIYKKLEDNATYYLSDSPVSKGEEYIQCLNPVKHIIKDTQSTYRYCPITGCGHELDLNLYINENPFIPIKSVIYHFFRTLVEPLISMIFNPKI